MGEMYGYASVEKAAARDLEAGMLYLGLSHGESDLWWGFVRKVYDILATQLLLITVKTTSHSSLPSLPSKFLLLPILCSMSTNSPSPSLRWVFEWADAIKKRGMRKHRALYTPDDWRAHRSSTRHIRYLFSSLFSCVILSLIPPAFSLTTVAAALALYNSAVSLAWLPDFFLLLRASSLPYQLTAPTLVLLLVFRMEASYLRFVEGRKAWMKVVVRANELAGMVISMTFRRSRRRVYHPRSCPYLVPRLRPKPPPPPLVQSKGPLRPHQAHPYCR